MTAKTAEPAAKPLARLAAFRRTIVQYMATCRGCQFATTSIREAHIHCVTEKHEMMEERHYQIESFV